MTAMMVPGRSKASSDRLERDYRFQVYEGVDIEDILEAAREQHAIDSLDRIDYAVLERHWGVSIIPKK